MNLYLTPRMVRPSVAREFALMDRMINDAFGKGWATAWQRSAPSVDVTETAQAFVFKAALPGWKPEQIEITVNEGVLSLKGQAETVESAEAAEAARWHRREIAAGSFERRFTLPVEVQADKAEAVFEHGVLTLTLPKVVEVKPEPIRIAVK
jgi:HSP20 family protein